MDRIKSAIALPGQNTITLTWREGLRAILCMLPMIIAGITGNYTNMVPLGQAAFFFSMVPVPKTTFQRIIVGSLSLTIGLGFYLIGGNVVANPWVALFFTFFVALNLGLLTGWKMMGPLALFFFSIYTAGLNASSPEKASSSFMFFVIAMLWSTLVSVLPIWKVDPPAPVPDMDDVDRLEQGLRMGIGATIALFIGNFFSYAKLGWAPSAVGNIVRYDEKMSKARAMLRFWGTIFGCVLAYVGLVVTQDPLYLMWIAAGGAFLNGILKHTKLAMMPLFYTMTIVILYSINDPTNSTTILIQRIGYNIVGISIGVFVAIYPFQRLMTAIRKNDN